MKGFFLWFSKRFASAFVTAALFVLSVVGIAYAALSWPSSVPSGETAGGKFAAVLNRILASGNYATDTTGKVKLAADSDKLGGIAASGYLRSESDPQVGTVTNGKWCKAVSGKVSCTADEPGSSSTTNFTSSYAGIATYYSPDLDAPILLYSGMDSGDVHYKTPFSYAMKWGWSTFDSIAAGTVYPCLAGPNWTGKNVGVSKLNNPAHSAWAWSETLKENSIYYIQTPNNALLGISPNVGSFAWFNLPYSSADDYSVLFKFASIPNTYTVYLKECPRGTIPTKRVDVVAPVDTSGTD